MKPTPKELQDLKSKIVRVGNGDQQKWISVPNLRHIVQEPFPIKKKKKYFFLVFTLCSVNFREREAQRDREMRRRLEIRSQQR